MSHVGLNGACTTCTFSAASVNMCPQLFDDGVSVHCTLLCPLKNSSRRVYSVMDIRVQLCMEKYMHAQGNYVVYPRQFW